VSTVSVFLRVAPDLLREIEAYRRKHDVIPPRTKAVCDLIMRGLVNKEEEPAKQPKIRVLASPAEPARAATAEED
jgi:hypothetical protein